MILIITRIELLPDNWVNIPSFTFDASASSFPSILSSFTSRALQSNFEVLPANVVEFSSSSRPSRLLDFWDFSLDSSSSRTFVQEFAALAEFTEIGDFSQRRLGAYRISSLPDLELEYGRNSDAYQSSLLAVKAALSSVG